MAAGGQLCDLTQEPVALQIFMQGRVCSNVWPGNRNASAGAAALVAGLVTAVHLQPAACRLQVHCIMARPRPAQLVQVTRFAV